MTGAADGERLQGRRALFHLTLDSLPGEHDGFTLYDCVSSPWADASVWLHRGQDVEDAEELTVEATPPRQVAKYHLPQR